MRIKSWRLALRNLRRNRRRSLATGAAIVAGFVGLILLGGYLIRVEKTLRASSVYLNHQGHVSIYKIGGLENFSIQPSRYLVSKELLEQVRAMLSDSGDATKSELAANIDWIGWNLSGAGLMSDGTRSVPFIARGVDAETIRRARENRFVRRWAPEFLTTESETFAVKAQMSPTAISLTRRLSELIGGAQEVQLAGQTVFSDLNAVNADVAAHHSTGVELAEDTSLLASLPLLQELYATDGVHFISIFLKEGVSPKPFSEKLNAQFSQRGLGLVAYAFSHPSISPNYVGSMSFLYAMSAFFLFLICGAVALSIVNSLTMGILERLREIGTLRAMGFRSHRISVMFAQESMALAVIGQVFGLLLAIGLASIVNHLGIMFWPPGTSGPIRFLLAPEWWCVALVFVLILVLSGVASYLTCRVQLRRRIVDLLADTGG